MGVGLAKCTWCRSDDRSPVERPLKLVQRQRATGVPVADNADHRAGRPGGLRYETGR